MQTNTFKGCSHWPAAGTCCCCSCRCRQCCCSCRCRRQCCCCRCSCCCCRCSCCCCRCSCCCCWHCYLLCLTSHPQLLALSDPVGCHAALGIGAVSSGVAAAVAAAVRGSCVVLAAVAAVWQGMCWLKALGAGVAVAAAVRCWQQWQQQRLYGRA